MKVIILDKKTYEFKEELDISKDYQIVLDIVLNQNSYFVTNHTKSISSIGDIIILHERSFFYIGVITNIELTDFGEIKLTSIDYISSLDFEINALEFNGNIGDELIRYIKEEYVENHDEHQNRPFLRLLNELDIVGKITVEDNKLTKFSDFLRDVYKQYKIRLEARLGILNGVITHLKIVTIDSRNEHILSSNFPMIRGLNISDNKEVNLNKITFIPNTDNVSNILLFIIRGFLRLLTIFRNLRTIKLCLFSVDSCEFIPQIYDRAFVVYYHIFIRQSLLI